MNADAEKAARERRVFQAFIQEAALPIYPESVQSRCPPEPDILCCHRLEGWVAFELAEICDSDIARRIQARHRNEAEFIRGSDPSLRILKDKLKKTYKTEYPVELLCYTAGRVISPDAVILEGIRRATDMNKGQFRRFWLVADRWYLVWP